MVKALLKSVFICVLSAFVVINSAKAASSGEEKMGDILQIFAPAYALGMTMMEEDYEGTIQYAEVFLSTQLATEGLKALKLEERPNKADKRSFPSGHSSASFSGAMFVHKRYGWKRALIPYATSIATACIRVDVRAHYVHDTVAGAALAALFTWVFTDKYVPKGVSVNADTKGISLGYKTTF